MKHPTIEAICQWCIERLAAEVHEVDAAAAEPLMEPRLEVDGVLAEEERVHVEAEGHGRIAELANSIEWLEPPGHADLDDLGSERAEVGDDVDVASAAVRGAFHDAFDRGAHFHELRFEA